jgi:hypothetical protein
MARERTDWRNLTDSVRLNRAGNAPFYKPVCVIAAIDQADNGGLVSDMLYAELILRRFGDYVSTAYPERASAGWQPLWYLANDGLWTFSKKGKRLTKAALETRPTTKNKALQRFDRQAIAPEYRALWDQPAQRKILRDEMLSIMNRYPESKVLVRALFDPAVVDQPDKWPSEQAIEEYFQDLSGQGELFRDRGDGAPAKPLTPAAASKALLAISEDQLPAPNVVGPSFEATGDVPIKLSPAPVRDVTQAQTDLYGALLQKCQSLEALASTSGNSAAHIRPTLAALASALESDATRSNGYLIWSHGNTLRQLLEADQRDRAAEDYDNPPLPNRLGVLLNDLVEQFNVYAITDPLVALLDRAKPGPAGRTDFVRRLEAGTGIVEQLRASPGILTPEATAVLETATENAQNAKEASGINAEQAVVNGVEIQRSGARAILQNALIEVRKLFGQTPVVLKKVGEGAAKQAGAETVKALPIASFVDRAGDFFIALWHGTTSSDSVKHIIALIRMLFGSYKG